MRYEEYKKILVQDKEFQTVSHELRPILDLADNILRLRLQRGWSQAELAKRAGTKQSNISRLESGQANPTYKLLKKIADAFGEDLRITIGEMKQEILEENAPCYFPFYKSKIDHIRKYGEKIVIEAGKETRSGVAESHIMERV